MDQELTLELKCPLCEEQHTYPVQVERSVVMMLMVMGSQNDQRKRRRFTRLFSCPDSDGMFQGSITLYETSNDPVTKVTVGQPIEEGADG
jgi:hypothetical protein